MQIGVLALQGAFREHRWLLEQCGATVTEVRNPADLDAIAGLIIPGGESSTIGRLMTDWGLMQPIRERALQGMAVYGTCAGMILLAKDIVNSDQPRLGLMDTVVQRNAFGRQRESFEADLHVPEFGGTEPVRAVFIRAPYIEQAGQAVSVLAKVKVPAQGEKIVIARQGKLLATAFHPELTGDDRIHRYFIKMVQG